MSLGSQGAVTAQNGTAPFISDEGEGVDWTHLRRDIESRLFTFTAASRPSYDDWRAGKLAGLGHNLHDGGDTP